MCRFLLLCLLTIPFLSFGENIDNNPGLSPPLWDKKPFVPKRKAPVFKGAFSVGMILVNFPDTNNPNPKSVKRNLLKNGPKTVKEYFVEYSQGLSWPECFILGEKDFPKNVYQAPKPKGYYCEFDHWTNPLGYKNMAEGKTRANKLRKDALNHAAKFKIPAGIPLRNRGPHVKCIVYSANAKSVTECEKTVGPYYKDRKHPWDPKKKCYEMYKPKIAWGDPLWPNSSVQVQSSTSGSTMCHELGHVLGAPDYYHAPENYDGVPGDPTGGSDYGPTGPGYCRFIYNGFLTEKNYPTISQSGKYTLAPRKLNPAGDKAVGAFIRSAHPHYFYVVEYVKNEQDKIPLGYAGRSGLVVQVVNVTMNAPYLGSPDLCYAYRKNDPWFRGKGKVAFFNKKGDSTFSMESEPSSRLPNLQDGGLTLKIIEENDDGITFEVNLASAQIKGNEYKLSTLPKISLTKIGEALPTSFNAVCDVLYRGEPLLTDYGFCWDTRPKPTLRKNNSFSMYHRDRYSGRALNLRPKLKYFVRAYVRNKNGVTYSKEEYNITLPPMPLYRKPGAAGKATAKDSSEGIYKVAPLLGDSFSGNGYLNFHYWHRKDSSGEGSTVTGTALTTLMKLAVYYRKQFTVTPVKKKGPRRRSPSRSTSTKRIDYTRIHTNPSFSRPAFRMVELDQVMKLSDRMANDTGMTTREFSKEFAKDFAKAYGLKNPFGSNKGPVELFTKAELKDLAPRIKYSLIKSEPVVVAQQPTLSSPIQYGLSWIIIDGFNDQNQFHIVYPGSKDRQFKRKSGWYSLEMILHEVHKAHIVWGLKPK